MLRQIFGCWSVSRRIDFVKGKSDDVTMSLIEHSSVTGTTMNSDLIRSSRGCSTADTQIQSKCNISFYAIVNNHNEPLEDVDCSIGSVRYDMVLECCLRPSQIGPHQVI
eukprot:scaffold23354_cov160-Skeletonema_marinoi.AAC.4